MPLDEEKRIAEYQEGAGALVWSFFLALFFLLGVLLAAFCENISGLNQKVKGAPAFFHRSELFEGQRIKRGGTRPAAERSGAGQAVLRNCGA